MSKRTTKKPSGASKQPPIDEEIDIEELRASIERAAADPETPAWVAVLMQMVLTVFATLLHRISVLERQLYGRKSEKISRPTKDPTAPRKRATHQKRRIHDDSLPEFVVPLPVGEEQKECTLCGGQEFSTIGFDESFDIEYVPRITCQPPAGSRANHLLSYPLQEAVAHRSVVWGIGENRDQSRRGTTTGDRSESVITTIHHLNCATMKPPGASWALGRTRCARGIGGRAGIALEPADPAPVPRIPARNDASECVTGKPVHIETDSAGRFGGESGRMRPKTPWRCSEAAYQGLAAGRALGYPLSVDELSSRTWSGTGAGEVMGFVTPIGVDDFVTLRRQGATYVDKTAWIAELLSDGAAVSLLPRPRRFGKTLNMSTVGAFLALGEDASDRRKLFDDLAIANDEAALAHFARYPVLHLSMKSVKADTWQGCLERLALLRRRGPRRLGGR